MQRLHAVSVSEEANDGASVRLVSLVDALYDFWRDNNRKKERGDSSQRDSAPSGKLADSSRDLLREVARGFRNRAGWLETVK